MSDDLREELTDAVVKEIFPDLPPHRAWYRFGFRSPAVLWSRLQSGHAWLSPVNEIAHGLQRWRRGWSLRDTWSFDYFMAEMIADGVAHMREIAHGYPTEITFEEWLQILQEIEDGMRAAIRIHDEMLAGDEADAEMEKFNLAMDHLKRWWFSLWD